MKITLEDIPLIEQRGKYVLGLVKNNLSDNHAIGTLQFLVTIIANDMRKLLTAGQEVDPDIIIEKRLIGKMVGDESDAAREFPDPKERMEYLSARAADNSMLREALDKAIYHPNHALFKNFVPSTESSGRHA